jgi:hypothetical protein
MQYALLIYQSPADFAAREDPVKHEEFYASFIPYMKSLYAAGVVVSSAGLQPPESATTVNVSNGQQVQDGPYADTKEQLGGLFVIDVPDLDTALDWARRCPGGDSTILEVRPLIADRPPLD